MTDRISRLLGKAARISLFAAFAAAAPSFTYAQTLSWDMANEYGPQTVPGSADAHFGQLVKDATGGRLVVTNQYSGSIGIKSRDMLDAVGSGIIPLGHLPLQAASGDNEFYLVSNLPFLTQSVEESVELQSVIRPVIAELLAEQDIELLYFTFFAPIGVWAKAPLKEVSDFAGLRLRTNDPISTTLFQSLGAAPLQISWADMLPQLQTGAISAVHTSSSGGVLGQLWELLPYYNDFGTAVAINAAVVSKSAMAELPEDVQAAVRKAAADTEVWAREAMLASVDKELKMATDGNATIVKLEDVSDATRAAFLEAAKPIIGDWLAKTGERGRAVLDAYSAKTGKTF